MYDIESISNDLQEEFEKMSYMITQGGILGEVAYFNAHKGNFSADVLISTQCDEFPRCEESDDILNLYQILDSKKIVSEFIASNNFKIAESGTLVEEYGLSQVIGYYYCIDGAVQVQIFPGNFAIPILFDQEPELPEISKPVFFGPHDDETEILENGDFLFQEDNKKQLVSLKKPKKVGRNDPCPCGSGIKYKKCCGKIVNRS